MEIYDSNDIKIVEVDVDDSSYRHRVIMDDHNITLHYSLAEHVEIPVGAYCEFQGERYTLMRPESLKMRHSRNFEYTVTLESNQAKAKIWKFRNPVDGRLKFSLTAKPIEHLQMFVDNMNRRDTGWEVGECVDGTETLISYNHVYCWDALGMMAKKFKTEFEFVGKTVHLRKVEYNKNNPLPLSYGRGNGFKPGVGRSNYGDTPSIEILYVQGGTDNIDPSKYKSSELLLPAGQSIRYDGVYFEGDPNFNPANARTYVVDDLGYSIRRSDKELSSLAEDSLDCSDIYPKRIGQVTSVVVEDADNNFYDIVDNTIPNTLNYEECLIEGETMTVIFQSGMLAGREFEVRYYHNAEKGKAARRFEIVPAEIDGQTMPNATFAPQTTDTYVVFKCRMPDAYVRDDGTKAGASWDMFRAAVKYLFDNEEQKFSFTGELDGIWSKKDWINISGKIKLGGYIRFSNEHFQKDGVLVRITGIKDYINKPHSPEIELSNSTVGGSFSTTLKQLESDEVLVEDYHRDAIQFTKRRFRDAKETMEMLEDALLDNFTNSISPIAIQTMQMLVGDESLQFRFVNSKTNPVGVAHSITYDNTTKQLTAAAGIIQHLTIGISSLSSSHAASEYRYWDMPQYTSGRLDNVETTYYLYAKVSKTAQTGSFLLSETAIKLEGVSGYYHLLVGVLNSEYDVERSFVTLYGFSEILPGRITTDRIVSGNGDSYFDMLANAMKLGSVLDFNSEGDGKLRLKGTLVQSQSGEENYIGCFRGKYNSSYTYYQGDEVTYAVNNNTSTYRMINDAPCKGIVPTNSEYWQVVAQGSKGDKGADGTSVKIKGSLDSESQLPAEGNEEGDGYLIDGNLYVWDGSKWINAGKIKGDKGDNAVGYQLVASVTSIKVSTSATISCRVVRINGGTQEILSVLPDGFRMTVQKDDGLMTSYTLASSITTTDVKDKVTFRLMNDKSSTIAVQTIPVLRDGEDALYMPVSPNIVSVECNSDGVPVASSFEQYILAVPMIGSSMVSEIQGWQITRDDGNTNAFADCLYIDEFEYGTGIHIICMYEGLTEHDGQQTFYNEVLGHTFTLGVWTDSGYLTASFSVLPIKQGESGNDAPYYEIRYARNGSTTTPPELENTSLQPTGWVTEQPAITTGYYLWMTTAKISPDGKTLLQQWSTPVRVTPYDGKDGKDGKSPAMVFRGQYDAGKTYYGNGFRLDCVKYGNTYYIARIDAGSFSGILPTNTAKWNDFGSSFDSVATELLLAENANIAGWIFRNGRLESENGNFFLNGATGEFGGIIKSALFYGSAKKIESTGSMTYNINPENDYANMYIADFDASRKSIFFALPKASEWDGLEISILPKSNGASGNDYGAYIRGQDNSDKIYLRISSVMARDTVNNYISVDNLNVGYTETTHLTWAFRMTYDRIYKFKSISDAWYCIDGIFTGE